jgi:hypothetical protein
MNDDQTPVELPSVRGQPPTKPKLTVCEVLTWIAFGEAIPKERLGESEREDLLAALEALEDKDACAIELVESDMDVRETRAAWNALEHAQRILRDAWRAGNLQASGIRAEVRRWRAVILTARRAMGIPIAANIRFDKFNCGNLRS